jgi:3-deoxy-D-manno-octulosonic-acid transferase
MKTFYRAYCFFSTIAFISLYPFFWLYMLMTGRPHNNLRQRLGIYSKKPPNPPTDIKRIWIHAVSVGEVGVGLAIIESLLMYLPDCQIILSTMTEHGYMYARRKISEIRFTTKIFCIYAPYDFIMGVNKALSQLKPDILVCLETEIWPNLLISAHKMGITTALINGRISVRTIKGYLKIRPLMKETLATLSAFSMIDLADAHRIRSIGAAWDKISINGNAKYDRLLSQANPAIKTDMAKLYHLRGCEPVVVAGSIRGPEEEILLDAYLQVLQDSELNKLNHLACL